MIQIIELRLYAHSEVPLRGFKQAYHGTGKGGRRRIRDTYVKHIRPEGQSPEALKLSIGRWLVEIEDDADYYYVVAVVRRTDNTIGFRTLIGRHDL